MRWLPLLALLALAPLTVHAGLPASPDIPPDDPLSRDMMRLSLRYPELSPGHTTRPFTRMEVARLLDRVQQRYGVAVDPVDRRLRARMTRQVATELEWVRGGRPMGQAWLRPGVEARCEGMIATGGDPYPLHGGDAAGPFFGCSWTAEFIAGPFAAVAEPRVAYDPVGGGSAPAGPIRLGDEGAVLDMPRGYVKLSAGDLELTAGVTDTAWGPSRGGVIYSGNSASPFMVRFTQPHLWRLPWVFRWLGEFKATVFWGKLLGPRPDVLNPNLLGMKFDWRPFQPWLEISVSRLSMFGGVGQPSATAGDIWDLIWGLDPHVDYDGDTEGFDANDIAAYDFTLVVPYAHAIPGVQFLQLYWVNAGEDVIRTYLGELPLPALTGVGNQGGLFLGAGPLTLRLEWTRMMDDRFRWYSRHRIYHDGYHHHGRVMGHPNDGDAESTYVELGADLSERVELWGWFERVTTKGAVDTHEGDVYTLAADRTATRAGLQLRTELRTRSVPLQAQVRFQLEHVANEDFVPGRTAVYPQLWLELRIPLEQTRAPRL